MRDATWRACKRCGGTLNVPPENTRSQRIEGERLCERVCATDRGAAGYMDIRLASASASRAREVTVLYALVLGCVAGIAQAPASRRDQHQGPEAWLEAQKGQGLQPGPGVWGGWRSGGVGRTWLLAPGSRPDRRNTTDIDAQFGDVGARTRSPISRFGTAVCAPHGSRVARHDLRG